MTNSLNPLSYWLTGIGVAAIVIGGIQGKINEQETKIFELNRAFSAHTNQEAQARTPQTSQVYRASSSAPQIDQRTLEARNYAEQLNRAQAAKATTFRYTPGTPISFKE